MRKQDKFNLTELFKNIKLIFLVPTFFYNIINFLVGKNFD